MTSVEKVITPKRYAQGFTYESYLAQMGTNRERFQESDAAFQLSSADVHFFQDIGRRLGPLKVLAIAEDWSPDVHRYLPVMTKIAQAGGMELRIFPRDKNHDIMNLYLNQGKFMSIPVFAFLGKDLQPLGHWIERPAVAARFVEQVNAELAPQNLSVEALRAERRRRSAPFIDGWRQEALRELKELLSQIAMKA